MKAEDKGCFLQKPIRLCQTLFTESKSGVLDVPLEELKEHLKKTYSDSCQNVPLPYMPPPGVAFDMSNLKVKEVCEFVQKAHTKSAPGML